MRKLAVAFVLLASGAFAGDQAPDTSAIMNLWGKFSFASGCPVAADRVLTNAHVLDVRPFDRAMPLLPFRYQIGEQTGHLTADGSSNREDLAWGIPKPELPRWYGIASDPPVIGERVWWVGYERKNRKSALERKVFDGKVLRIIAGNIIIDRETPKGSSGSCVLNSRGEVLGIIAWGFPMESMEEITIALGLYGDWLEGFFTQPE